MIAYVVTGWPAKWLVGAIFLAVLFLWVWLSIRFLDFVDRVWIQPSIRRAIARAEERLKAIEEDS